MDSTTSRQSALGSIPIARSINPDDSVDLTRLSYLNSTKNRRVLDGSWTVLDLIGRCPAKSMRVFLGIFCGGRENRRRVVPNPLFLLLGKLHLNWRHAMLDRRHRCGEDLQSKLRRSTRWRSQYAMEGASQPTGCGSARRGCGERFLHDAGRTSFREKHRKAFSATADCSHSQHPIVLTDRRNQSAKRPSRSLCVSKPLVGVRHRARPGKIGGP